MMAPAIYFAKSGKTNAPTLPADAVTRTFGIFGVKDSGKTTTGRVIAEGICKLGGNVVVLDPVGVWWGITRAGEGPGVPGIVIGGEHADVPLEETGGHLVAEVAMARQWPVVVIDLKLLRKGAAQRFMADFLEEVYLRNRKPLHLIFEEADRALPQSPRGMSPTLGRVMGAAEDIVKLGRSRGLGSTFLSQRMATVTKNVTEQVEAMIWHAQIGSNDRRAVKDWIEGNGDPARTKAIMDTMASLDVGEAWLYSPKWLRVLERVRVKMPKTLDSSSTPTNDEREVEEAAPRAPVELGELRRMMAETVEREAANDPKVLRARIEELESRVASGGGELAEIAHELDLPAEASTDDIVAAIGVLAERAGQRVLVPDPGLMAALSECVSSIEAAQGEIGAQLALARDAMADASSLAERALRPLGEWVPELTRVLDFAASLPAEGLRGDLPRKAPLWNPADLPVPQPKGRRDLSAEEEFAIEQRVHEHAERTGPTIGGEPAVPRIRAAMRESAEELSPGAAALLEGMRGFAPLRLTRLQLATLLRRGPKSSTLTNELGELKAAGEIEGTDAAGYVVAGSTNGGMGREELRRVFAAALPEGPRALFDVLAREPGEVRAMRRDALFEAAGFSATSSTPTNHLKLLKDNGLVEVAGPGWVQLGAFVRDRP